MGSPFEDNCSNADQHMEHILSEKTVEVPSIETISMQSIVDLFTTAVEQGIGYWAVVRKYKWSGLENPFVELKEDDQIGAERPGWMRLTAEDLIPILPRLREIGQHKGMSISEIMENQDAETADCAFQFALFGEIVYG